MKIKNIIVVFHCWILIALNTFAINSATITAQTLQALPSCLHYRVKGVCVWVSPITGINTTPYLEHYLPDVVVSVFNKPEDDPWSEMKLTLDSAGKIAEQNIIQSVAKVNAGSGQYSFANPTEQHIYFKEAEVIGNPALLALPPMILLPSAATPLKPYFQSMLDSLLWRGLTRASVIEEGTSVVTNLKYHVGQFPIDWGGLYPHEGFLVGTDDANVAAVIAMRAIHLITLAPSERFGHLSQMLPLSCGKECSAAQIEANDTNTQLQRIYPSPETSCSVIGNSINQLDGLSGQTNGAYVWVVWRKYEGCVQGDGAFVERIAR